MYIFLGLEIWLLDIPGFSKESIRSSCGWSVMGKWSDPCVWFVGGWGRRGLEAIITAADVVLGPTTLSESGKLFEILQFSVESLPALYGWTESNIGRGLCPWFLGGGCFREGGSHGQIFISELEIVRHSVKSATKKYFHSCCCCCCCCCSNKWRRTGMHIRTQNFT